MAEFVQIAYGNTFNTGNYESIRIDATVRVDDATSPEDALAAARDFVHESFRAIMDERAAARRAAQETPPHRPPHVPEPTLPEPVDTDDFPF